MVEVQRTPPAKKTLFPVDTEASFPTEEFDVPEDFAYIYKFDTPSGNSRIWPITHLKSRLDRLRGNEMSASFCATIDQLIFNEASGVWIEIEQSISQRNDGVLVDGAASKACLNKLLIKCQQTASTESEHTWVRILFDGIAAPSLLLKTSKPENYPSEEFLPLEAFDPISGDLMGALYSDHQSTEVDPNYLRLSKLLFQLLPPKPNN